MKTDFKNVRRGLSGKKTFGSEVETSSGEAVEPPACAPPRSHGLRLPSLPSRNPSRAGALARFQPADGWAGTDCVCERECVAKFQRGLAVVASGVSTHRFTNFSADSGHPTHSKKTRIYNDFNNLTTDGHRMEHGWGSEAEQRMVEDVCVAGGIGNAREWIAPEKKSLSGTEGWIIRFFVRLVPHKNR